MKAWVVQQYGKKVPLVLSEMPKPAPSVEEVLIRIHASSINPVDIKIKEGKLRAILPFKRPFILGNDCSGIVESVGANVKSFKPGDEVYCRADKNNIGTFTEYVTALATSVALKPANISFAEAASLPLVGLTSWQALFELGKINRESKIFIPAGSGGVGCVAIQIAKHAGAYVATNTSTKNVEFVRSLGADEVIDYTKTDFSEILKDYDFVFDTMGGETQIKAQRILKKGGTLVSIVGPPTVEFAQAQGLPLPVKIAAFFLSLKVRSLFKKNHKTYQFFFMRPSGEQLTLMARLVEGNVIKPIIDRSFPFLKVNDALEYVSLGRSRGKVVVTHQPQESV